MTIKILKKSEIIKDKLESESKKLEKAKEDLLSQIKESINMLIDLDCLYEVQEYVEDLIIKWKEIEFDSEEDE